MQPLSNPPLAHRRQDGDPIRPLAEIAAERRGALIRYAARLLGDPDRAQDVVQDALVKFMAQDPAQLAGREAEWLFTVCRHRAFDLLRKDERMDGLSPAEADGLAGSERRPGQALEEAEIRALLLGMIESLPANQQEVIRLKFQNGFSYREIARITDLSVGNVGFLIHTAVGRLRREWTAAHGANL
jgi:RNA polymerase sigma-70 factor (ECF subfamily)